MDIFLADIFVCVTYKRRQETKIGPLIHVNELNDARLFLQFYLQFPF